MQRGAAVVALEADTRAIAVLKETFPKELSSGQLSVHHTDVRSFHIEDIPQLRIQQYKVVANIPYYLSGFLFRMFLEADAQPTTLVFLVQKEVAKRVTSSLDKGEKESLLSLSAQAYGTPVYIKTVSRGHFTPPPNVDSGIVALYDISKKYFQDIPEALFFEILHLGFGQKRKQLLGNLTKKYTRDVLQTTFSSLHIPLTIRAEDVPLEKWLMLTQLLSIHS